MDVKADAPPAAGGGAKGGLRRRRSRPRQYSQYIYKSLRILQPRRRPRRPGAVAHRQGPQGIRPPSRRWQRADRDRAPRVGEGEKAGEEPADDPAPRKRRPKRGRGGSGSGCRRHIRHVPMGGPGNRDAKDERRPLVGGLQSGIVQSGRASCGGWGGEGRTDAPTFAPEAIF